MITWYPDTCACIADNTNRRLIVQCRTHNTWQEMRTHNNSFADPTRNTEDEQRADAIVRELESKKPQYQRR